MRKGSLSLAALVTVLVSMNVTACGGADAPPAAVPHGLAAAGAAKNAHPAATNPAQHFLEHAPPAAFTDPARKAKLALAFLEIDKHFARQAAKAKIPGLAAGIVIDGELAWSKGYGARDLSNNAPVDADTVFRIGSLTKGFTAMAVLELRDAGKLSLEDPAVKYLPELADVVYPTRDASPFTIRQLLSHTSGLPRDGSLDSQHDITQSEVIESVRQVPLQTAPGTAHVYSNLGYSLLGVLVARVSGVPYRQYMASHVLTPLGMSASTFREEEVSKDKLAVGYVRDHDAFKPAKPERLGESEADGGLYSSMRDLSRYAAFQLGAWPPRDEADNGPLRRASVRELHQPAAHVGMTIRRPDAPVYATSDDYGFGWVLSDRCEVDRLDWHSGAIDGFGSVIYVLPEHGVAIIAIGNVREADPQAREALRLLTESGGLSKRIAPPNPALVAMSERINKLVDHWDPAEAEKMYAPAFLAEIPVSKIAVDLGGLKKSHGACHLDGELKAPSPTHGRWTLACEHGHIDLTVWISPGDPSTPAKINGFRFEPSLVANETMTKTASRVAGLVEKWDDKTYAELLAPAFEKPRMKTFFAGVLTSHGACAYDPKKPGVSDDEGHAKFELSCAKGKLALDLNVDEKTGKVGAFSMKPVEAPATKCAK